MNFNEYLDQAWTLHATDSKKVLSEMKSNLLLAETYEDLLSLAHLLNHVAGVHLGEWSEGINLMNELKNHKEMKDLTPFDRYITSLSLGKNPDHNLSEISNPEKARIWAMTASALGSLGIARRAKEYLENAKNLALKELDLMDPAHRNIAVAGNTIASTLEEKTERSPEENDLMKYAAFIGREFWEKAGTWLEIERAEYRLANTFLTLRDFKEATKHAELCLAMVIANGDVALEGFFGYETIAKIARASGDETSYRIAKEKMKEYFYKLSDADKSWCEKELLKFI
ncbi:MAG: hypothetical protein K2Q18_06975 [Bdellovibrionales bacterium]|nr:hypothetical protein [Bdellovibrionales bacterium]